MHLCYLDFGKNPDLFYSYKYLLANSIRHIKTPKYAIIIVSATLPIYMIEIDHIKVRMKFDEGT